MKTVEHELILSWFGNSPLLSEFNRTLGAGRTDPDYVDEVLKIPRHLNVLVSALVEEEGAELPKNALDSISFYDLCLGLWLPMDPMEPEISEKIFELSSEQISRVADIEEFFISFLRRQMGLSLPLKVACLMGDPFMGKPGHFQKETLFRLLKSLNMITSRELSEDFKRAGEVAILFAEFRPVAQIFPPLTAAEVLLSLGLLPTMSRRKTFGILRSVYQRCGKMEAYFLARLLLGTAGLGKYYNGPLIGRAMAEYFKISEELIMGAMKMATIHKVASEMAKVT